MGLEQHPQPPPVQQHHSQRSQRQLPAILREANAWFEAEASSNEAWGRAMEDAEHEMLLYAASPPRFPGWMPGQAEANGERVTTPSLANRRLVDQLEANIQENSLSSLPSALPSIGLPDRNRGLAYYDYYSRGPKREGPSASEPLGKGNVDSLRLTFRFAHSRIEGRAPNAPPPPPVRRAFLTFPSAVSPRVVLSLIDRDSLAFHSYLETQMPLLAVRAGFIVEHPEPSIAFYATVPLYTSSRYWTSVVASPFIELADLLVTKQKNGNKVHATLDAEIFISVWPLSVPSDRRTLDAYLAADYSFARLSLGIYEEQMLAAAVSRHLPMGVPISSIKISPPSPIAPACKISWHDSGMVIK